MTDEFSPHAPEMDLLGLPWTEQKDPRGRKSHKRSPQIAENVALLRGTGLTEAEIARRIGLSEPTLRKYYFRELDDGPALLAAVLDEAMFAKAKTGNVAAYRAVRDRLDKGEAKRIQRGLTAAARKEPGSRPVAEPKLGKKEQAAQEALRAGQDSDWGDDLAFSKH